MSTYGPASQKTTAEEQVNHSSLKEAVLNSRTPRIVEVVLENQQGAETQERLFAAFEMVFDRCEEKRPDEPKAVDKAI